MYTRLTHVTAVALVFLACAHDDRVVSPVHPPSVRALVSSDVAALLNSAGHFPDPVPISATYPQISAERARQLADAYRRIHLPGLRGFFSQERGRPIHPRQLQVCGRPYYAEPNYEPDDQNLPRGLQNALGPHWIIHLCEPNGLPALSVAVAARAVDLELAEGRLLYPKSSGGEFFLVAVPSSDAAGIPVSPEAAAAAIANATGKMVAAVPRLIPMPRHAPQLGLWMIRLSAPATVRTGTGTRTTPVLLYGNYESAGAPRLWVPAPMQSEEFAEWGRFTGLRSPLIPMRTLLRRRADVPVGVTPVLEVLR